MRSILMTTCVFTCLLGCGDAGTGSIAVGISGEEAAVVGFPVGTGADQIAFADGFTLTFDAVLISVGDFRLETGSGDAVATGTDPVVVDLSGGDVPLWAIEGVSAQRWDEVSYRTMPATAGSRNVNATAADLDQMIASGTSLWVRGTATDGAESFAFSYAFDMDLDNHGCTNGIDETDGIIVRDNATTEAQITIHLDHLFFDSYATEEPSLRFEPMAAMAVDGSVDLDLLAGQSLSDLFDREGGSLVDGEGAPIVYDPGPLPIDASNLAAYVRSAATTTGHFNGEGHCEYR